MYRSVHNRPPHNRHTTTYNESLINHCIRFACNSEGTEELPDDDTHVSKHVGAAKQNNKLLKSVHLLVIYKHRTNISRCKKKSKLLFPNSLKPLFNSGEQWKFRMWKGGFRAKAEKMEYSEASQFVLPAIYIIRMTGQMVGYVARTRLRHELKSLVWKHKLKITMKI
jgi:hypothetical protein